MGGFPPQRLNGLAHNKAVVADKTGGRGCLSAPLTPPFYGHTTTAMHDNEYTPLLPPRPSCDLPNTSRRFALGASNVLPGRRKPDVLRLGIVGMQGSMVIRLRLSMPDIE